MKSDAQELLELVQHYASKKVTAALERRKDPWTSYGMGSIQEAAKAEEQASIIHHEIKEKINALSKRT